MLPLAKDKSLRQSIKYLAMAEIPHLAPFLNPSNGPTNHLPIAGSLDHKNTLIQETMLNLSKL